MTAKTDAQRKREERERMSRAGFRRLDVWVHDDDRDDIVTFIERRNLKRIAKQRRENQEKAKLHESH